MKRGWCSYLLFLIWLSYLFFCGVMLFARGFLLSRQALPNNGTCEQHDCSQYREISETDPTPLNKRLYLDCMDIDQLRLIPLNEFKYSCKPNKRKIIILVIDALKYEFAQYNSSLPDEHRRPYQNRLPIFHELLQTLPNNSRLVEFIANPPTTTLQRLKGLTTGSLPTFIDAGLNFGTPEISEDNILNQVQRQGRNIVTMGDDIWPSLFPNRSIREYPYPSFNMFDLDTVDNGVIKHLKKEIYEKDWSLLIGHFLGVDHCGHAFGPNHPEMTRKLTQMNAVIKDLVDSIDENTMLFVMGDHGMTGTGDHGGDSQDEISAALFVYSPIPLMPDDIAPVQPAIYQVDLVPTVAYLMGTAIPFSNLGKVALELLPRPSLEDSSTYVPYATEALASNIEQIMLYINTYSRYTHLFSKDKISTIASKFHDLCDNLEHVHDAQSFAIFRTKSVRFLNFVRELFEEVWVQFDSFLMSRGLVLSFLLLSFTFIIIEGLPMDQLEALLEGGFLWGAYGVVGVGCAAGAWAEHQKIVDDGVLLAWVSTLTLSIFLMAVTVVQNWKCISSLILFVYWRSWWVAVPRFLFLCSLLLFFSNSFVVEEGQVMQYLTITSTLLAAWTLKPFSEQGVGGTKHRKDDKSWVTKLWAHPRVRALLFALLFAALLRLSSHFWRCREEQSWCTVSSGKGTRGSLAILGTLALLGVLATSVRMWLRACGNLVGFSPAVALARYAPTVIVVCIGGYWVLQGRGRQTLVWQQQLLPWTVYTLVASGIITAFLQPLCVFIVNKKTDSLSVYGQDNIIPQLFRQVKEVISEKGRSWDPIVYGLGTVYSSVLIGVAHYMCLLLAMLLGDQLASSAVLMLLCAFLMLFIHAYCNLETAIFASQLFHVQWSTVISWGFLTSYFFYGTGHQPTFPTIQWHAAFVGTGGQLTNHFVPALLVGLNTFCAQVIMGLLSPLLVISPFTLYVMLPKWLPLSAERDGRGLKDGLWAELKRGEVFLYEKEGTVQFSAFRLAAKLLLFYATRVIVCMLAAAFHCRHLMVWKVFAPRLIFEALSFFVTIASLLVSFSILGRISVKVDDTLTHLTKTS